MKSVYGKIVKLLAEGQSAALETEITGTEGSLSENMCRRLSKPEPVIDSKGRNAARVVLTMQGNVLKIQEPFLPAERLIVLGGGHIALPAAEIGAMCGMKVCVVDDRPEFASAGRFPMASQVICAGYESGITQLGITASDYVVIITHGHKYDADCLRTVISGTMPAYLGMIGSRRRVQAQMEILRAEGYDPKRLESVCTPIGLNIGAVTPEEIAVSIMAEVIAYRRLAEYGPADRFYIESDVEPEVLEHLACAEGPMALATVIEAEGSSPRGAGAKMIVFPDGTIDGSVGGGMAEAAAIREALALIGTGRYKVLSMDLSGDVSGYDAMACGGKIRILVEDLV
ncbi:MAG: XdhC family protein [Solobacterium sp.]|nr:XdhC family protein [Solobacterium sp.]